MKGKLPIPYYGGKSDVSLTYFCIYIYCCFAPNTHHLVIGTIAAATYIVTMMITMLLTTARKATTSKLVSIPLVWVDYYL